MSKPFFIWTMRRTGGTSLTDLLMQISEHKTIEHEPFNLDRIFGYIMQEFRTQVQSGDTSKMSFILNRAFSVKPLIKHCYEIIDADFNELLVENLKDKEYKHIFLLRKDEVSRILSLFLAYQTNIWGKHGSEQIYDMIHSGKKVLEPFDMDHIRKEEETAISQTQMVKSLLERESVPYKAVYFEDFFTGKKQTRLDNLYALFGYLEFDKKTIQSHKKMIDHILFGRSQKSHSILKYVPNYKEAKVLLNNLIKEGYDDKKKRKRIR